MQLKKSEMNLHAAQNILAETELRHLAAIPYQIVSPALSSPLIGIYQDSLLGSYLFTRPDTYFTPRKTMELLMSFPNVNTKAIREAGKKVSSFQILSQIMKPITLQYKNKLYSDNPTENNIIEIRNGEWVRGQIEKSVMGSATKGILHRMFNDFGGMVCSDYIDNLQNIINEYMKTCSFSVGISDLIANKTTMEGILHAINKQKIEVQSIIERVRLGIFENNTANDNNTEFEIQVTKTLNKATEESGRIGRDSLSKDNRFLQIVSSGSKGSLINISQMISGLGQQNVDGKRIPYGFDSRTLPHFSKYDDSPSARGFIENSYISGLSAPELFFHAMAGRIGLIDTAVKSVTWETPIVIIENNTPIYTEIGRWIDARLDDDANKSDIKYYPDDRNMELLDLSEGVYIQTVCDDGYVFWGVVSAITRHDPGDNLYEIVSESGRTVTVAESQSLLIWDTKQLQFLPKNCPDVNIGDGVPVTISLQIPFLSEMNFNIDQEVENISNGVFNIDLLFADYPIVRSITNALVDKYAPTPIYSDNTVSTYPDELFSIPGSQYVKNPVVMEVKTTEAVNGLSLLFARVDMPTKIDNTNFTVTLDYSRIENSVKTHVMVDPIVSIRVIGTENHPKLYDLTVPSTLNFCLANGLGVRDTSSTGYIQRRLIKGLEDLQVNYDMTVRNSKGVIVQFAYGEDGFDPTRVESQVVPLAGMSLEDIYLHYDILGVNEGPEKEILGVYTKATVTRMKKQRKETAELCKKYIEKTIKNRDLVVKNVFKYKNDNMVKFPVAFQNIIANIQGQLHLNANSVVDITPFECFQLIESYYEKFKKIHYVQPNMLFDILYYYYLSPKDLLVNKRFHSKALVVLLETILLKYKQAIVHPGEMVGIIAGQSTGEPLTQLSILRSEKIKMIRVNKTTKIPEMISGEIGTLCDNLIKALPEYTFNTGHKDSVETLLEPLDNEYYIVGVDEKEKTHWNKISHVSRHIVNGDMIRVKTKSGRVVETTMSHSHLIRKDQSVQPILGADMTVGMRIPVAKHIDNEFVCDSIEIGEESYKLDDVFGLSMGVYLANKFEEMDNSFVDMIIDAFDDNCVPDFAFLAPNEFKRGLLMGFMDNHGVFMCDSTQKYGVHAIRVYSNHFQLLKDISLLFGYFDIFGSLVKNEDECYYHISSKYAKQYQDAIGSKLYQKQLQNIVDYANTDAVNVRKDFDKINGLGEIIAKCEKILDLEESNWDDNAISRSDVKTHLEIFETHEKANLIEPELAILRQAAYSGVVWDEIVEIERYTPSQTEYVYDFTVPSNQTFMTDYGVIVHNTLNSVTYDTEILVRNSNKELQKVQIGKFTDNQILLSKKIEYIEEKNTTYAELSDFYEVPCATEDGETVWRRIEAVTQHPVINEDGTNTMLKVTTKGNRTVTATKAKSFLQLIDGKIQHVNGKDLKVGDYLPVSRKPLEYTEKTHLDLRNILPPTEYIYGSEMKKASAVVDEHRWWSKYSRKTFTLPYSRSDSAYAYLKRTCNKHNEDTINFESGFVYTKQNNICNYKIPENIELDYDFGYLCGAYAAEGCMTAHQLSIANLDENYYIPILRICEKFNITTKIYSYKDKGKTGWNSKDIRIYSTLLCKILENLCGKLSHNKYVSPLIVFSNKECICGFLDAYISGDGTVNIDKSSSISATSTSYQLLLDIQIMMKNLDITSKINKNAIPTKDVVFPTYTTKLENVHQTYYIRITNQQCNKLANILNLSINEKQTKILSLREHNYKLEYCKDNLLLPNIINGKLVYENRDNMMMDLEFDKVVSIEEILNPTPFAYDLTVEGTRNFDIYNSLCLAD